MEKHSDAGNSAAADYFQRAIASGSKSPQDYMLVSELLFRSGQRSQAIAILKQAVTLFTYIPTPYENLSYCYMAVRDYISAKDVIDKGLSTYPGDSNLQAMRRKLESLR